MNLWVKHTGQLLMAAALFFLSCEEDTALLGFKANQKFNVHYQEIPLESSLLLIDSLRTSNLSGETNRLLVGKYNDDLLGGITSGAYTQYYRNSDLPDSLSFSVFDSVSLHLAYDYYYYGSDAATTQEIAVYELDEELDNVLEVSPHYYNNSFKQLGNQLGSKTFEVRPAIFDDITENSIDTTLTVRVPLDQNFGQRIFDAAVKFDGATTEDDSVYVKLDKFIKEFKGISIQPVQGDKVIGFNPLSKESKIVVHFHLNNRRDSLVLAFGSLSSFSTVTSDKAGSDVMGLENYNEDFTTLSGNRYTQSGVGIVTKIDLTNFLNFASNDTIPAMIINSAQFVVDGVLEPVIGQPLSTSMVLRVLGDDNRFRKLSMNQDSLDLKEYSQTVGATFVVLDDVGAQLNLNYNKDSTSYSGSIALFLQELYKKRNSGPLFSKLALYPTTPPIGKSVNLVAFNKDNIKLRIYYTVPTVNTIE
jgi:Domain of unknown function (DUF4270)